MNGALIVFEGQEGVGKTTQLRRAVEWLSAQGRDVTTVREPGGTPLGDAIRHILLDSEHEIAPRAEALLFMASRAELVERKIRPALDAGGVVLLDRFFLSTYAYQGAGRGVPDEEIRTANRLATRGLVPSLTVLLTLDTTEGLARAAKRGGHDRIERAERDFHDRVATAFSAFSAPSWQQAHPECGPIVSVDASGDEDAVFGRVRAAIETHWPASSPR